MDPGIMEGRSSRSARKDSASHLSLSSQTAAEFIDDQLQLEADAREALPYAFDTCTQPLGPLRQTLFSCLTCNPPPSSSTESYTPAGVCYSCSIACHGEHTLVELFSKRNFVCDCGTTRLPATSSCSLRLNPETGRKSGSHSESPAPGNQYNHNFQNRFCGCNTIYVAEKENSTMYQCLGLGSAEEGGCGEDWWHPACVVGLGPEWHDRETERLRMARQARIQEKVSLEHSAQVEEEGEEEDATLLPPGFPDDKTWDTFICWKCVDAYPWIKRYAGTQGFLHPAFLRGSNHKDEMQDGSLNSTDHKHVDAEAELSSGNASKKRKAADGEATNSVDYKRTRPENGEMEKELAANEGLAEALGSQHERLPPSPEGRFSLFMKADFRDHLCRCAVCFPKLAKHPQLLEEEDVYELPLSETGGEEPAGSSVGTGSLLDRGERALSNVDRVRAIEGVMVYNDLKEKVKSFLKPFAETGKPVGAEDVKEYFEKLRGDAEAVKAAKMAALREGEDNDGDNRREQSGY